MNLCFEIILALALFPLCQTVSNEAVTLHGHSGFVTDVAESPDGKTFATSSYDGTVRLWDVQTGNSLLMIRFSESKLESVAFGGDGKTIVAGDEEGRIFSWCPTKSLSPISIVDHDYRGGSIACNCNTSNLLATASNGRVTFRRLPGLELVKTVVLDQEFVGMLQFTPDGKKLWAYCGPLKLRVIDAEKFEVLKRYDVPYGTYIALSHSNQPLFVASWAKKIEVRRTDTWEVVGTFEFEKFKLIRALGFGADENEIVIVHDGRNGDEVSVWRIGEKSLAGHFAIKDSHFDLHTYGWKYLLFNSSVLVTKSVNLPTRIGGYTMYTRLNLHEAK